jgi:Ca2+-binding EF-hand superfamily protein
MKTFLPTLSLALFLALPALAQPMNGQGLERLRAADLDGDGAISRQELLQHRVASFGRFDRNGDGYVSPDDLPAGFAASPRAQNFQTLLAELDLDGDGGVSQEEMAKGPTPLFDAIDTDADGYVTPAELSAAAEQFRASR